MSLQLLAKQMEAKGRDGDSVLVHMTPGEVEGLQKLAESAGGTLTVNPETGLVEANFLKKVLNSRILPTLAGVAAGAVGGPMAGAAAGALVGGLQAKESDQNVLLGAGLGALGGYGGAGIGAGLSKAGVTAAQAGAMNTAATAGQAANLGTAANVGASALPSGLAGAGAEGIAGEALAQEAANATLQQELKAQAINQAADKAAADYAAKSFAARTGEGIQALAGKPGRDAFLSEVGMKELGMAAAPTMLPEARDQSEVPVDDEMYSYTYDVGRTGAERTPSGSSAERKYFDGRYSPMRKIRASQYGMAEGGEVADAGIAADMTGASKAAFDYLMGNAPSTTPQSGVAAVNPYGLLAARSDREFVFDPETNTFIRNAAYGTGASNVLVNPASRQYFQSGSDSNYSNLQDTWSQLSDAEKAAYYAENPTMGAITRGMQGAVAGGLSLIPGGSMLLSAQDAMAPGFRENQSLIARGIDPMGPRLPGEVEGNSYLGISNFVPQQAPAEVVRIDPNTGVRSDYDSGGWSPSANQDFGGGFNYGGDYDSFSSDPSPSTDYAGYDSSRGDFAAGGLMGLAKGGMASGGFVIPADVVSMVGEGNTDAGYKRIKAMVPTATAIKGKDGGQADTVKTSIDGKQPARVAHGEMYVPPETVKRMGGAKKLYAMMDRVRKQATGSKEQIKPVNLRRAMA